MKKIAKIIAITLTVLVIIIDIVIMSEDDCWPCFLQVIIMGAPWSFIFLPILAKLSGLIFKLTYTFTFLDPYNIENVISYILIFLSQAINIILIYFIILWIGKIYQKFKN